MVVTFESEEVNLREFLSSNSTDFKTIFNSVLNFCLFVGVLICASIIFRAYTDEQSHKGNIRCCT